MDVDALLDLLMHGNQLKRTARTGWGQRGVASPENVAAHSYGVVFAALVLVEVTRRPLDVATVLALSLIHI